MLRSGRSGLDVQAPKVVGSIPVSRRPVGGLSPMPDLAVPLVFVSNSCVPLAESSRVKRLWV